MADIRLYKFNFESDQLLLITKQISLKIDRNAHINRETLLSIKFKFVEFSIKPVPKQMSINLEQANINEWNNAIIFSLVGERETINKWLEWKRKFTWKNNPELKKLVQNELTLFETNIYAKLKIKLLNLSITDSVLKP